MLIFNRSFVVTKNIGVKKKHPTCIMLLLFQPWAKLIRDTLKKDKDNNEIIIKIVEAVLL